MTDTETSTSSENPVQQQPTIRQGMCRLGELPLDSIVGNPCTAAIPKKTVQGKLHVFAEKIAHSSLVHYALAGLGLWLLAPALVKAGRNLSGQMMTWHPTAGGWMPLFALLVFWWAVFCIYMFFRSDEHNPVIEPFAWGTVLLFTVPSLCDWLKAWSSSMSMDESLSAVFATALIVAVMFEAVLCVVDCGREYDW